MADQILVIHTNDQCVFPFRKDILCKYTEFFNDYLEDNKDVSELEIPFSSENFICIQDILLSMEHENKICLHQHNIECFQLGSYLGIKDFINIFDRISIPLLHYNDTFITIAMKYNMKRHLSYFIRRIITCDAKLGWLFTHFSPSECEYIFSLLMPDPQSVAIESFISTIGNYKPYLTTNMLISIIRALLYSFEKIRFLKIFCTLTKQMDEGLCIEILETLLTEFKEDNWITH